MATSSDRFFAATAMAGRLHLRDIGDHSAWDPTRIVYNGAQFVEIILRRARARTVWTVEELDEALVESQNKPGSIDLYVQEHLLSVAHERWEEMRKALPAR